MGAYAHNYRIILDNRLIRELKRVCRFIVYTPFYFYISRIVKSVSVRTTPPFMLRGTNFDGILSPIVKCSNVLVLDRKSLYFSFCLSLSSSLCSLSIHSSPIDAKSKFLQESGIPAHLML